MLFTSQEKPTYRYALYDHVLASPFAIDGLSQTTDKAPLVHIYTGPFEAPSPLAYDEAIAWHVTDSHVYLKYPGVGSFLLGPEGLAVTPDHETSTLVWQRWLLGPMFGLWLQRNGFLVLHANAVAINGKAVLLLGHSGAGKTTLTTALVQHGAHLITDDVAVLRQVGDSFTIAPGPPWLKLTPDTWRAFQQDSPFEPQLHGKANHVVPINRRTSASLPVAALFALSAGESIHCAAMHGNACILQLQQHAHMPRTMPILGTAANHFMLSGAFAQRVPFFALQRSQSLDDLPQLIGAVESAL